MTVVNTPNTINIKINVEDAGVLDQLRLQASTASLKAALATGRSARALRLVSQALAELDRYISVNGGSGYSPSADSVPAARQCLYDAIKVLGEDIEP